MTELSLSSIENPFDALKRVREDGSEYWSARELMPVMGYAKWQTFEDAISRAKISAQRTGLIAADIFTDAGNNDEGALGRPSANYHLTRHAAYLVAMNGDPRKEEIANAQAYFAIRTREAEQAFVVPTSFIEALELAIRQQRAIESAQRELEAAKPKVEVYDDWFASESIEMTDFAKRIGFTPVTKFTARLRELRILRKDRRNGSSGSFRNLPTSDWEHAFDVVPTQIHSGEWLDVARVNPGGQLEILEALRDNGHDV